MALLFTWAPARRSVSALRSSWLAFTPAFACRKCFGSTLIGSPLSHRHSQSEISPLEISCLGIPSGSNLATPLLKLELSSFNRSVLRSASQGKLIAYLAPAPAFAQFSHWRTPFTNVHICAFGIPLIARMLGLRSRIILTNNSFASPLLALRSSAADKQLRPSEISLITFIRVFLYQV